ncbi:MAG: hypothetical protein V3S73_01260 [Gammaproteobacteria bacterium]
MPIALCAFGWLLFLDTRPIYAGLGGYDYDPAYVYLFNGLNILKAAVPGHIDHPGTPLQVLSGIVIFVKWSMSRVFGLVDTPLTESVLIDPEGYIATISSILLVLNVAGLFILGYRVKLCTGSAALALMAQTTPFFLGFTAPRVVYLSPEALLMFASFCLLAVLMPEVFRDSGEQKQDEVRTEIFAGLICGIGLAVKITFLPLTLLLLLLRPVRRVRIAATVLVVTLCLSLIPIISMIPSMASWYYRVLFHTGKFGTGDSGLIDLSLLPRHLMHLWINFPIFFVAMVVLMLWLITTFLLKRTSGRIQDVWTLRNVPGVFLLVGLGHLAVVLKHYGIHHFIHVLPVAILGLIWVLWTLSRGHWVPFITRRIPALGAILCSFMAGWIVLGTLELWRSEKAERDLEQAAIMKEMRQHRDAVVIAAYRSSLPSYAILFGLSYTRGAHRDAAGSVLTNVISYNRWNKRFRSAGKGWLQHRDVNRLIQNGRTVILVTRKETAGMKGLDMAGFVVEKLIETKSQNIYRLRGVRGKTFFGPSPLPFKFGDTLTAR